MIVIEKKVWHCVASVVVSGVVFYRVSGHKVSGSDLASLFFGNQECIDPPTVSSL